MRMAERSTASGGWFRSEGAAMFDPTPETSERAGFRTPFGTPCPWHDPDLADAFLAGQYARFFDRASVRYFRPGLALALCDGMLLPVAFN